MAARRPSGRSGRFLIETSPPLSLAQLSAAHAAALHDPMTECVYEAPLESFEAEGGEGAARGTTTIGVLSEGRAALERAFADESARANAFFEEAFRARVQRSPVYQSYLGIKDDYDRWNDLSEEHAQGDLELAQALGNIWQPCNLLVFARIRDTIAAPFSSSTIMHVDVYAIYQ